MNCAAQKYCSPIVRCGPEFIWPRRPRSSAGAAADELKLQIEVLVAEHEIAKTVSNVAAQVKADLLFIGRNADPGTLGRLRTDGVTQFPCGADGHVGMRRLSSRLSSLLEEAGQESRLADRDCRPHPVWVSSGHRTCQYGSGGITGCRNARRCTASSYSARHAVIAVFTQVIVAVVYSWSVFRGPLGQPHGWSKAETITPYRYAILMIAIGTIIGGLWQDRKGARLVASVGGLLVGIGFLQGAAWLGDSVQRLDAGLRHDRGPRRGIRLCHADRESGQMVSR